VQGITAPFLMFHGTADTTVQPSQSVSLQNILNSKGVPSKRLLYQGINHDIINSPVKQADIHAIMRAWFTQHGVLVFPGNSAPTLSMPSAVTIANGQRRNRSHLPSVMRRARQVRSLCKRSRQMMPACQTARLTMGGSGANRTLIFTPPSGRQARLRFRLS
jgi:hypothetical protein